MKIAVVQGTSESEATHTVQQMLQKGPRRARVEEVAPLAADNDDEDSAEEAA